jgi:hypothetical protein
MQSVSNQSRAAADLYRPENLFQMPLLRIFGVTDTQFPGRSKRGRMMESVENNIPHNQ